MTSRYWLRIFQPDLQVTNACVKTCVDPNEKVRAQDPKSVYTRRRALERARFALDSNIMYTSLLGSEGGASKVRRVPTEIIRASGNWCANPPRSVDEGRTHPAGRIDRIRVWRVSPPIDPEPVQSEPWDPSLRDPS